jgi:AraC family transcriptional regulator, regulatory protein of adaptative response / methylated-DNA-[protein]-cysteine methyltransferase
MFRVVEFILCVHISAMSQYDLVARIIEYITTHPKSELSLDTLANVVELSPSHLQKIFTQWCGVSPKQFQRFLSLEYAKTLLAEQKTTLQTSVVSGLSSTGRLHDLFVDIEAMTPGEFKNGGQFLEIMYSFHDSQFGRYIIASTVKGICNVLFFEDIEEAVIDLISRWPNAHLLESMSHLHQPIIDFFAHQRPNQKIHLHLRGTNYQLQVWRALLTIPEGSITNYGTIATQTGDPKSSRAVGTAISDNPVGYIIPCHRVLKSTGEISGYRWGVTRKQALIAWEAARTRTI